VACCREYSIAVVCYNPLAGGLLTGKHRFGEAPAAGTRFDGNKTYLDRYWHEAFFDAVAGVSGIALRAGMSTTALAFRWLLAQPPVDCVLLGASSKAQLDENLRACDGPPLDKGILAECDAVWKKLRGVLPKYNR
jgi:aryl-alcohol dehydrogenase-like predicted oxidoreductase